MIKKRRTAKWYHGMALTLSVMLTVGSATALAQETAENDSWRQKIDAELAAVMETASDTDLIPVWLWRDSVPVKEIDRMVLEETGMNPAVYEDNERFEAEIAPALAASIENRVGYEAAHYREIAPEDVQDTVPDTLTASEDVAESSSLSSSVQSNADLSLNDDGMDRTMSLVDRAIHAEINRYNMSRREIVSREYTEMNHAFLRTQVGDKDREVIYNSLVTSTIIVEATKAEINDFARSPEVNSISLYEEVEVQPALCDVLDQIHDTSVKNYANGTYNGTGIKIGIIEAKSLIYDPNAFMLKDVSNLFAVDLSGVEEKIDSTVSKAEGKYHATTVTSIIKGKSVTCNGKTFEGVVPNATVYQAGARTTQDILAAMRCLVMPSFGVNIINMSLQFDSGLGYHNFDKEVDEIICNTGIIVICSAGNKDPTDANSTYHVTSPGKALNAITVGNAATKSLTTSPLDPPYHMHHTTKYVHADYLPNKPDVAAPGIVNIPVSSTELGDLHTGTSIAAPIVTGIVAQMLQKYASMKGHPEQVKAKLMLNCKANQISTSGNDLTDNSYLRQKSGAGLVHGNDAALASNVNFPFHIAPDVTPVPQNMSVTVPANKTVRIVMTFLRQSQENINSAYDLDELDLYLFNAKTGQRAAYSSSIKNNVEIIEFTSPYECSYLIRFTVASVESEALKGAVYWKIL